MQSKEPIVNVPDSHLQNPIRLENRRMLTKTISNDPADKTTVPGFILNLKKTCPIDVKLLELDSERLYGIILSDVYSPDLPIMKWVRSRLPPIWGNVCEHIKIHNPFPSIDIPVARKPLTSRIMQLMSLKQEWECLRIKMQKFRMTEKSTWDHHTTLPSLRLSNCWLSQLYIIVVDKASDTHWLMDYDQVMMICDTITARVFSYIYAYLMGDNMLAKLSDDDLTTIYKTWDILFENYGNDSFSAIKAWEPIIQGLCLTHHDNLRAADKFLAETIRDKEEDPITATIPLMVHTITSLSLNIHQLGELHGIYRHWGHPTVHENKGCAKVRKIAHGKGPPNAKTMWKAKAVFVRQFCISFIGEHGRWPRVDVSGLSKKSPLFNQIKNNVTTLNFYSPRYSLSDWGKIDLEKEFEFDYHVDYTEMCQDKAISPYLQDLPTIYAKEALGYDPGKTTSSRRVLLELLRKKTVDIKEICRTIMKRQVPDNWKVILVHPKERELKLEPRLFAMFVLEMRLYFAVTESNIAHTIFKYFPQQSMTLSENELTKRLYNMSGNLEGETTIPLFMSIDFQSWNIYWQYSATSLIQKQLDRLFGTPGLYTYSHVFFMQAIVSISSRYNPPSCLINDKEFRHLFYDYNKLHNHIKDHVQDDTIWTDHNAGFEGILQKLWTLITIVLLLILEIRTGIKCIIIGQGDNQFIKIHLSLDKASTEIDRNAYIISHQEDISRQLSNFVDLLAETASDFKLIIKKDESWVSSCIVNYGKDLIYEGAYLSQGIKRASRVMADVNDLYPTLFTKISSMQTTGLSIAQKGYDIWVGYFLCQVETLVMIQREMMCPSLPRLRHSKVTKDWVKTDMAQKFFLHGDSNCLGIPITNMNEYLYRGAPDPLTVYLTVLTQNCRKCLTCMNLLKYLFYELYPLGDGDHQMLVDDPLSINRKQPRQLANIFRVQVQNKLQRTTMNQDLKPIFSIKADAEDKEIAKYLIGWDPIYPRLLHEVQRQTVSGTRMSLVAKFSSSRTIYQMLSKRELESFFSRIIKSEIENMDFLLEIAHKVDLETRQYAPLLDVCPTRLATTLRNRSWRMVTDNRLINGVTIPFPLHQFDISESCDDSHQECDGSEEHILYLLKGCCDNLVCHTRGPYTPFVGHKTREKLSGKVYQIPEVSRPLQAAERLIQISQWCLAPTEDLTNFITTMIKTRTNIPISILDLSSGAISSGSYVHRLNDHVTKRGVLSNMRSNSSSHIYLSTDNMGKYGRGSDNVNMHFQGAILTGITYLHSKALYNNSQEVDLTIHQHYSCDRCEEYIPDTKIVSTTIAPKLQDYGDNPLLYTYIENVPMNINPESLSFQIIKRGDHTSAMAFLLFSRILININRNTWGLTQKNKPYMTKISVRSVINIGIRNVLSSLAHLLYYYYNNNLEGLLFVIVSFGTEIWQDLGPACLLPEVLESLFDLSGECYQPQLYESSTGYTRLLNRALIKQIKAIISPKTVQNSDFKRLPNIIFYIVPGCGISRIFRMWANMIAHKSNNTILLQDTVASLEFELSKNLNLPNKNSIETVERTIINHPSELCRELCWRQLPLKLSKCSPEVILGSGTVVKRVTRKVLKEVPRSIRMNQLINTGFSCYVEVPWTERESLIPLVAVINDNEIQPIKKFTDHSYHLVANLSSSYLKILQIVKYFNIDLTKHNLCLADGEGSITRLISLLSNKPVIFNTKIDNSKLIPQRATGYIPGEMIDRRCHVKLSNLSAIYGGDLLDNNFLTIFMCHVKEEIKGGSVGLITCDAEMAGEFSSGMQTLLLKNILKIAYCVQASCLVYKCYLNNLDGAVNLIGMCSTMYEQVVLVVPTYSAPETYEFYLVCKCYSPTVAIDEVGNYIVQSTNGLRTSIQKTIKERISPVPHMQKDNAWIILSSYSIKLKFPLSIKFHLERLSDFNLVFDTIKVEDYHKLVHKAKQDLLKLIQIEWKGLSCITSGTPIDTQSKVLVARDQSMHKGLIRYIVPHINFCILMDMLKHSTLYSCEKHMGKICDKQFVLSKKERRQFVLNRTYQDIKRDHLRSLWACWGYYYNIKHLS